MILEIILGITTITFGYTSFNLFRKVERLEDWVEDYSQRIVDANTTLGELDSEGKFESDDEIGVVFEGIKNTIKDLSTINNKDISCQEKQKKDHQDNTFIKEQKMQSYDIIKKHDQLFVREFIMNI